MNKHDSIACPRCKRLFECRPGDISHCQCYVVKLTQAERDWIAAQYADCLCAACLSDIRISYHQWQQEERLRKISSGR